MKKLTLLLALLVAACSSGPVIEAGSDVSIGRDWNAPADAYPEAKGNDESEKGK